MKQTLFDNLKNIYGWKTNRKLVVFSIDDYGNVRLDSSKAREEMDKAGMKAYNHFDALDTLETREDLEALYEVLTSVEDKYGGPAIFTPFAMPCNINFEAMAENNYTEFINEQLPETYKKLSAKDAKAYEGTWRLWQEGIEKGLMKPQFHGREHLNLKVFKEKLEKQDSQVLTALKNRSYTSISNSGYPTISITAAFHFWEFSENESFKDIIKEGLNAFEDVYGYRSIHFNAPGGSEHPVIHQYLHENGVECIDTPFIKNEHQGKGKYKKILNYTGKKHPYGIYQVRNVVFEPTVKSPRNWVDFSLKQIEAAFRWNKPAIVSSHRVNFCGHIAEKNRQLGLSELKLLLQRIVAKWPDVEFINSEELYKIIKNNSNAS